VPERFCGVREEEFDCRWRPAVCHALEKDELAQCRTRDRPVLTLVVETPSYIAFTTSNQNACSMSTRQRTIKHAEKESCEELDEVGRARAPARQARDFTLSHVETFVLDIKLIVN
jgi:hypothetical protein